MNRKVAVITLHGMGKTDANYASELFQDLRNQLKDKEELVSLHRVFYDGEIQQRQDAVYGAMTANGELGWQSLREFVMYSLADAIAMEAKKVSSSSPYFKAQFEIAKTILTARRTLESNESPVIILAHSLGCQVISNYIWDATQPEGKASGVWSDPGQLKTRLDATDEEMEFLRLRSLEVLITVGCNIPVFVAALAEKDIVPIDKPKESFEWLNLYDKDDILGYPLRTLSPAYDQLVKDIEVNVGPHIKSLTPLSHLFYWQDRRVQGKILEQILRFA